MEQSEAHAGGSMVAVENIVFITFILSLRPTNDDFVIA